MKIFRFASKNVQLMLFRLPNGFGIVPLVQRIKPKLFWQKWNFRAKRLKKVFSSAISSNKLSPISIRIVLNNLYISIINKQCNEDNYHILRMLYTNLEDYAAFIIWIVFRHNIHGNLDHSKKNVFSFEGSKHLHFISWIVNFLIRFQLKSFSIDEKLYWNSES